MQTLTYPPRPIPFVVANGAAAAAAANAGAATGVPFVAGNPGTTYVPTSGGGFILSPTANQMEMFPISSPGTKLLNLQYKEYNTS